MIIDITAAVFTLRKNILKHNVKRAPVMSIFIEGLPLFCPSKFDIFQLDCNDGWERIDCDMDKSSDFSNFYTPELLTFIDSFLDSIIGSIFFQ